MVVAVVSTALDEAERSHQEEIIRELGGQCKQPCRHWKEGSHEYDDVTHAIVNETSVTLQDLLCAIQGKILVPPSWARECEKQRHFVDGLRFGGWKPDLCVLSGYPYHILRTPHESDDYSLWVRKIELLLRHGKAQAVSLRSAFMVVIGDGVDPADFLSKPHLDSGLVVMRWRNLREWLLRGGPPAKYGLPGYHNSLPSLHRITIQSQDVLHDFPPKEAESPQPPACSSDTSNTHSTESSFVAKPRRPPQRRSQRIVAVPRARSTPKRPQKRPPVRPRVSRKKSSVVQHAPPSEEFPQLSEGHSLEAPSVRDAQPLDPLDCCDCRRPRGSSPYCPMTGRSHGVCADCNELLVRWPYCPSTGRCHADRTSFRKAAPPESAQPELSGTASHPAVGGTVPAVVGSVPPCEETETVTSEVVNAVDPVESFESGTAGGLRPGSQGTAHGKAAVVSASQDVPSRSALRPAGSQEATNIKKVRFAADGPSTSLPETEPKVNEPKVNEPKVNEPKVNEPKVNEPKVNEPKVNEPKVNEPKVNEPKVNEPKVNEPKVNEPSTPRPSPLILQRSRVADGWRPGRRLSRAKKNP